MDTAETIARAYCDGVNERMERADPALAKSREKSRKSGSIIKSVAESFGIECEVDSTAYGFYCSKGRGEFSFANQGDRFVGPGEIIYDFEKLDRKVVRKYFKHIGVITHRSYNPPGHLKFFKLLTRYTCVAREWW